MIIIIMINKLAWFLLLKTDPSTAKQQLKENLNTDIMEIIFQKVNGDLRNMRCTTNIKYVPIEIVNENSNPKIIRSENPDVCRVFDLDKKEWRSFKYDNLIDIK